jgi:cell division FtsZ-interacting protein ZapD
MRIEAQSVEFIMDKVQECLARGIHDLYVVLVKAPKKAKTESSKLKDLDRSIRTLSSKKSLDLSRQERIKAALNQINSIMGDLYGNKVENHKAGSNKSKPSGLSVVGGRGFDWADRANYRVNRTVKSERSRAALKLVG